MNNNEKIMGFLGLCRRAGKLACGHDAAKEAVTKEKAELVFLAKDASDRQKREMTHLCSLGDRGISVIVTGLTMAEFDFGIGKRAGVYAVTDKGFANKLIDMFREVFHEET